MFRFESPIYLYLLALVPIFIALYVLMCYRKRKQLKKFGDAELVKQLMPDDSPMRRHVKFSLMMLALTLMAFVLARPQYGLRTDEEKRAGIEVSIAVDVSNSMLCEDVSPSRLDKAKMIVSRLIEQFDEDKLSLVAFAGNSVTLLPMTADYVSAKMFLDQLNPTTVSVQGTNMSEAITRCMAGFSEKESVGRALILITDAEDNEEGAVEAAKAAREAGIRVFVLSVGTAEGNVIPMPDGSKKKDSEGNVVITKLNESVGKSLAQAGDGVYIHVDQTDQAQAILSQEIEKMQKEDFSVVTKGNYDEQFIAVAIILFIILVIEICIIEKKNPMFKNIKLFKK